MDIYFVRHGQTDGNVARRHQHPNIELNEVGKMQAVGIAKEMKRLRPTHLITSTNVRAIETARQIALASDLIPETYPAFEELHRPQYLIGERYCNPTSMKYVVAWFFGVKAAPMHDGESYDDLLKRLAIARTHLESLPKDAKVVIVSHSAFINFFLEHMNRPHRMGITRAFFRFIHILRLHNTCVVHVRHDERQDPKWKQLRP